jgi:mannan endo-1,4-beta-mannosidase
VYNDLILDRLDDLLYEACLRGIKLTVALHDRWSLGCWRNDAYQRKYNLTKVDCSKDPAGNDPSRFYTHGRDDFANRIEHVLGYISKHTHQPIGQWKEALLSVEAENEAFGHVPIAPSNSDWMCAMSAIIRTHVHPSVLVTTGGGGVGTSAGAALLANVGAMAACASIDVLAVHSYASAADIDLTLTAYKQVITPHHKRMILQEWGVTGINSTAQAVAFAKTAAVAAKHGVPQLFWGTVHVFRQDFALEDVIGSHACSLEANMRVTNGIPLGSPLLLPLST